MPARELVFWLLLLISSATISSLFMYSYPFWVDELNPSGDVTINVLSGIIENLIFSIFVLGIFSHISHLRKTRLEESIRQESERKAEQQRIAKDEILEFLDNYSTRLARILADVSTLIQAYASRCQLVFDDRPYISESRLEYTNMTQEEIVYFASKNAIKLASIYEDFRYSSEILTSLYATEDVKRTKYVLSVGKLIQKTVAINSIISAVLTNVNIDKNRYNDKPTLNIVNSSLDFVSDMLKEADNEIGVISSSESNNPDLINRLHKSVQQLREGLDGLLNSFRAQGSFKTT